MEQDTLIPTGVFAAMLMRLFEFSPTAICVSTAGSEGSRYVKVNASYLRLTGLRWEEIRGKDLVADGAAVDDPGRARRSRLLDETGSFLSEEVSIRRADGTLVPTLISAQRTVADGVAYDIELIIDISARVAIQRELERHLTAAALTDALTGLPNRAHFDRFLAQAVAPPRERGPQTALAFIDLNGFKAINDGLGHETGDEVLRQIADRLRSACRASDFVARIGGDEFAIVLAVEDDEANRLSDRLAWIAAEAFAPVDQGGHEFSVGAAIGVAMAAPGDDAAAVLRAADRQMYAAKATGNAVCVRIAEPCPSAA